MSEEKMSVYEVRKRIETLVDQLTEVEKASLAGWILTEAGLSAETARMLDIQISLKDWAKAAR